MNAGMGFLAAMNRANDVCVKYGKIIQNQQSAPTEKSPYIKL